MKKYFLLLLAFSLVLTNCKKNDDDVVPDSETPPEETPNLLADFPTQNFMWRAMNFWYFWQADVPNLTDDKFTNAPTSQDYVDFLASETDPAKFFEEKLQFGEDRFSFFSGDFKELTQALSGISKSNGLEFQLVQLSGSDDIFGYVRYIIPNSDASTKEIKRGDLFTGVDGQTLNLTNFRDLLFGDNDTYVLNMADISDNTIDPNNIEVSLDKMEGLSENPVFLDKVFDIGGQKIGYLVYNGFTNEYDEELNDAFGRLKSAGATELVLDLRYNGGGSVNSSRLLSSMIFGTNTNNLYLRQRWNAKVQAQFSEAQLTDNFANQTGDGTSINTLNLSKVYVLATNSSASASELVMNGLDPYMQVIHIGETTRGKNEFSITMVDDPENTFIYSSDREANINPNNQWAIQPLVGRNENADGFSDYTSGFVPDIELEEDLANLGAFGDENEPLLARALQEITGVSAKTDFTVKMPFISVTNSKMFTPMKDNMYLDTPSFTTRLK